MTNNEALVIAAHYDIILEMTGIDFKYSLELLEESKKADPIRKQLESIQSLLTKKVSSLNERKEQIKDDLTTGGELEKINALLEAEKKVADKEWEKVMEGDFSGTFKKIELSKVPTEAEHLDRKLKDGVSIARMALLFLIKQDLIG